MTLIHAIEVKMTKASCGSEKTYKSEFISHNWIGFVQTGLLCFEGGSTNHISTKSRVSADIPNTERHTH